MTIYQKYGNINYSQALDIKGLRQHQKDCLEFYGEVESLMIVKCDENLYDELAKWLLITWDSFLQSEAPYTVEEKNEPKVNINSFRVENGELLPLKSVLTFEQWRDKHFKLSLSNNPDSPKDVYWISRKTSQAVFSNEALEEYYVFQRECL